MPKLAIAFVVLLLVALAGVSVYAGYLVVGVVSDYLGIGRFLASLFLGIMFVRLPLVRQGKLSTVGVLPKAARLPIVMALLSMAMLSYFYRSEMVPVLCLFLAAALLLACRWMKLTLAHRMSSFFSKSVFESARSRSADGRNADPSIIDAEFREKKD